MSKTSYKKSPYEYGFSSPEISVFKTQQGINQDVVKTISRLKHEDDKMFNFRLRAFQYFTDQPMPSWGPNLSDINFDNIIEKNNIVAVDFQGKIIWITNNHGYVKNNLPFEQMIFKDGWIYASDFYARRFKINYRTGDIENVTIAK